jgi:hypothetical protein
MKNFKWETSLYKFLSDSHELMEALEIDNITNVLRKVRALKEEISYLQKQVDDICKLTNTNQIANAKQRIIKLMDGATPDELSKLPEAFHKPPYVWIYGKYGNESLGVKGFAPMRPRDAERRHRAILPLLIEAWELSEGNESERSAIEKAYRNWSPEEFERELYATINRLEEPTLEDLLEERLARETAEFEHWKAANADARYKHDG